IKKNMTVFRSGSPAQKRAMAHEAMGKAAETIDSFKDQSVSIADLTELQQRAMGPLGKVKKHVRDNLRGYQMFTFLVVWISVGALFFCVRCDKSFIQGVYFSVATMSTAGLQAVCFDRDDPSTSGNLIFAAFFSLSGVPLYAMALGTFASQLLEGHQKRLQAEKMGAKINEGEIAFVQNLLGTGDDEQADSIEFAALGCSRCRFFEGPPCQFRQARCRPFRFYLPRGAHEHFQGHNQSGSGIDSDRCGSVSAKSEFFPGVEPRLTQVCKERKAAQGSGGAARNKPVAPIRSEHRKIVEN
ncbi:unnamed protein product, partial [Polarella glacialis]